MQEQAMLERFAALAGPRLIELLRLKIPHVYDPTEGHAKSVTVVEGQSIQLKIHTTVQPYGDIQRFLAEDKVMGYVINPGLLSIAKVLSQDIRGRRLLVTRKIAGIPTDKGVVAHLEGLGVRIQIRFDAERNETQLIWECLYGVA